VPAWGKVHPPTPPHPLKKYHWGDKTGERGATVGRGPLSKNEREKRGGEERLLTLSTKNYALVSPNLKQGTHRQEAVTLPAWGTPGNHPKKGKRGGSAPPRPGQRIRGARSTPLGVKKRGVEGPPLKSGVLELQNKKHFSSHKKKVRGGGSGPPTKWGGEAKKGSREAPNPYPGAGKRITPANRNQLDVEQGRRNGFGLGGTMRGVKG